MHALPGQEVQSKISGLERPNAVRLPLAVQVREMLVAQSSEPFLIAMILCKATGVADMNRSLIGMLSCHEAHE